MKPVDLILQRDILLKKNSPTKEDNKKIAYGYYVEAFRILHRIQWYEEKGEDKPLPEENRSRGIDLLNKALKYFPNFYEAITYMGQYYQWEGENRKALECYENAYLLFLEMSPEEQQEEWVLLDDLAEIYRKEGMINKSMWMYEKLIDIHIKRGANYSMKEFEKARPIDIEDTIEKLYLLCIKNNQINAAKHIITTIKSLNPPKDSNTYLLLRTLEKALNNPEEIDINHMLD